MYRIKHKPTGLYYQPHKHGGNTLSRKGKIYHKKETLKYCSIQIHCGWKEPQIAKEIKQWLNLDWEMIKITYKARYSYGDIIIPSNISDWEHEEVLYIILNNNETK